MQSSHNPKVGKQHQQGCFGGCWILRVNSVEAVLVFDVLDLFGSLQIAGMVEVVSQVKPKNEHAAAVVEDLSGVFPLAPGNVDAGEKDERRLEG